MRWHLSLAALALLAGAVAAQNPYYPAAVGSYWDYDGVELNLSGQPVTGTEYTTRTSVVGTTTLLDLTWFVQTDTDDQGGTTTSDTSYFRFTGDTIQYLMPLQLDESSEVFWRPANVAILPGSVGQEWEVFRLDTFMVDMGDTIYMSFHWWAEQLAPETVTVPAGTYTNAKHLRTTDSLIYDYSGFIMTVVFITDTWPVLNVGPVKSLAPAYTSFGFPINGHREELTDFSLPVAPGRVVNPPADFGLDPAYPNPFNPVTTLGYRLDTPSPVMLEFFDTAGRLVQRLDQGFRLPGNHQVVFEAAGLPSGVYFVRLQAGSKAMMQRVTLMK
ncbi:MAG: T9SS C-terminal target domain-containing protein [Candidatus Zixiibacteriota bacterium]|nr:MAG: T9SS C-terminal target domain-containing protein [candidate division Zixibacteria bacterium]